MQKNYIQWFSDVNEMREALRAENEPSKVYHPILADEKKELPKVESSKQKKSKAGTKEKEEKADDKE